MNICQEEVKTDANNYKIKVIHYIYETDNGNCPLRYFSTSETGKSTCNVLIICYFTRKKKKTNKKKTKKKNKKTKKKNVFMDERIRVFAVQCLHYILLLQLNLK